MAENTGTGRGAAQRTFDDSRNWSDQRGGQRERPAEQTALVRVDKTEIEKRTGVMRDEGALSAAGQYLAQNTILLTPITNTVIPAGFGVQVSAIYVQNLDQETYPVKGGAGKRGIGKALLNRIAQGSGIEWDTDRCVRLDDGSDPHYCLFQVVAVQRGMDNRLRPLIAVKEMDLRDGSSAALELLSGNNGRAALAGQRAHIVSHAETKAKLRLIREATGMRHAYSEEELARPFCAAKLVFTGDFGDEATNREVHLMVAAQTLGLSATLFGNRGTQATAAQLPSEVQQTPALPPPTSAARPTASVGAVPGSVAPPPLGRTHETPERDDEPKRVLQMPADDAPPADADVPEGDGPITLDQFERMSADNQVRTLVELARVNEIEISAEKAARNSAGWRTESYKRLLELQESA